MGTGKICAFTLAVTAILGQTAWADDAPANGNWFSRLFKLGKSSGPKDADHQHLHRMSSVTSPEPTPVDQALAQAAYNRRMDACLKLKNIANATNDDALRRKAEQLDELIWQEYSRRTAHLPGGETFQPIPGSETARNPGSNAGLVPGKER